MGLFTVIKAINSTSQLVDDLVSNEQVKSALFDASVKGLNKIGSLFDKDGDGVLNKNETISLIEYSEIIASVLGHAALADGIVNEHEEDEAWNVLQKACFEPGGILSNDILKNGSITKKEVKKSLTERFNNPISLKKIAKYSIEKDIEDEIYEMACIIVSADKTIHEDEIEFLCEFSKVLEMSKFDIKRINKKYLKD